MLPDNRIRLSPTKIDFDTEVGNYGQDIDNYPPEGGQARFDHMRSVVIGLLSQQSSYSEPSQKRDGTPWFDLNTMALKIWRNNEWQLYSEAIPLADDGEGNVTTLADWFTSISGALSNIAQEITFSGISNTTGATLIPIPESLRTYLFSDSRASVYINGLLVDPRNARLEPGSLPTAVKLIDTSLQHGDVFSVYIRRIPSSTFYTPSVVV